MLDRNSELNRELFKTEPVRPMDVHTSIWRKRAEGALKDGFDRYAFYTSRSIFVSHPEVYLRADRRFFNHISTVPGYTNAFLENNRESREFLPHAQYYRSAPFSLELFPWGTTKTVTSYARLYPDRYPVLPLLDTRMLPLASTLKTTSKTVTELEMASIRFVGACAGRSSSDNVFVLYSEDGLAWVAVDDKLICAATGKEVPSLKGKVILVMNDNVAWYPLMGRTDVSSCPGLKDLVRRLGLKAEECLPRLRAEETSLLPAVKKATALDGVKQEAAATIAAVRSTGRYTKWFEFHALWDLVMPANKVRAWQYYGFMEQFMIRANTLSPITAYMAACASNANGYDRLLCIDREWVDLAALPNHNYVWGHLWDECLVEYTVDESARINSGHCMAQACIISSVLELSGIDHYVLEGEVPSSHHFVFVPEYEFTFDNGKLQSSQNTIHWNGPRGNKVLARFHYKGKFSSPIGGGHYSGTFSPEEAVQVLRKLKAIYNDSVVIYQSGEHETRKPRIDMAAIPVTEDLGILLKEEWEELRLP